MTEQLTKKRRGKFDPARQFTFPMFGGRAMNTLDYTFQDTFRRLQLLHRQCKSEESVVPSCYREISDLVDKIDRNHNASVARHEREQGRHRAGGSPPPPTKNKFKFFDLKELKEKLPTIRIPGRSASVDGCPNRASPSSEALPGDPTRPNKLVLSPIQITATSTPSNTSPATTTSERATPTISSAESCATCRSVGSNSSDRFVVSGVVRKTDDDESCSCSDEEESARKAKAATDRPPICLLPIKQQQRFAVSLSGCGFLGTYHFGVVACFQKNGKAFLSRVHRFSGASMGSLVAATMLLAPEKVDDGVNRIYQMADELHSLKFGALTPGYYIQERLEATLNDVLPQDISAAQGRMFVSLTNHKTRGNTLVSRFESRRHLIQCLSASCYIPMYSRGIAADPPMIDGKPFIDGGYSNNLPDFPDIRTVTVTPFSSTADICPSDPPMPFEWKMTLGNQLMKVNLRNIVRGAQALFPPSKEILRNYYRTGYLDAFKFLHDNGFLERSEGTAL